MTFLNFLRTTATKAEKRRKEYTQTVARPVFPGADQPPACVRLRLVPESLGPEAQDA